MISARLTSLDILRGATMALLCLQILRLPLGVTKFPDSQFWQVVSAQASHVPWSGMALWDLIQPLFMFMVGVALPWSVANRKASGESLTQMWVHVFWRALGLIAIGLMLRSLHAERTQFEFVNVLAQIGLGYPLLFALAFTSRKTQLVTGSLILLAVWLAYVLYPAPDYASHWLKDANFGAAFDRWFMNLWPREEPFVVLYGGYSTFNFLPSMVTMLAGALTGDLLRTAVSPTSALKQLIGWSVGALLLGYLLHVTGLCPSIKRIWTPSWVLISGGLIGLLVALTYWVTDMHGYARPFEILRVVGLNSLILYVVLHLWDPFLPNLVLTHLGWNLLSPLSDMSALFVARLCAYALLIGFCVWLDQRKIYLRL